MNKSALTVLKGVSTIVGGVVAGPTGALIGNLTGSLLQSFLPDAPEAVKGFTQDILNDLAKDIGKRVFKEIKPEDQHLVNHDLQTAFRDAFIQAVHDIGGKKCFPAVWRKKPRIIPQAVVYFESTGCALWVNNGPLKKQVTDCLKDLVKVVEDGKVLPMEPLNQLPASDVRSYLVSTSPEQLSDAFFNQVLQPFLDRYKSLMVELPDFLTHLKRHLLDRTLVYLGENLKQRAPAWRAYNRMVLEQYRSQLTDLGRGQEEICKRIDNLIQSGGQGETDLSDGLADLLSAIGVLDKKLDEQLSSILDRVVEQHRELVQSLELLTTTSLRIESKVDRVLRILEDGHFVVEGTPPVAANISPEPGEAPFQGMQFFDEKDAGRFFGRENLVAKLAGRLCSTRFLAVVGASGSGKSSVVRAGLLPELRLGKPLADGSLPPEGCKDWQIHLITPGEHPLEAVAVSLTYAEDSLLAAAKLQDDLLQEARSLALAIRRISQGKSAKHKILLVIDQFEEIFTLCRDEKERQAFLDNLFSAISLENAGPLTVVITLRADFYDECGRYPQLRMLLQDNQEYIGPMSTEELQSAIEKPARLGNWEFERGLVDLILRDVGEEPGALPLLSHALLETWNHRRGRMMTLESYAEAGGVRGAIAQTAETVYHKRLTFDQQTIARGIFLRLTELGEGTQDTRRRVALNELVTDTGKQTEIESVLAALVNARLITTTEDSIEVAHEALIREWPLLRIWLSEDRETLRLAVGVRAAAREWQQGERDASLLIHRGGRLEEALELLKNGGYSFNPLEIEYLRTCLNLVEGELRARERLRNRLTIATGAVMISMLLLGLWGLNRAREANHLLEKTISQQLVDISMFTLDEYPIRSLLLSIEALRLSTPHLPKTEENMRQALAVVRGIGLSVQEELVETLVFSPDGNWLAVGTTASGIHIWNIQNLAKDPVILHGDVGPIKTTAFSPDEHWLATGCMNKTILLWNMQNLKADPVTLHGHKDAIVTLAFSPDGHWLATGSYDNTARVWDMQSLKADPLILQGHEDLLTTLSFSPDGRWLATGSYDNTARVWDMQSLKADPVILQGHKDGITKLAFSPDGRWLATGSNDKNAHLWDMQNLTANPLILQGHEDSLTTLSFSPDGRWLATGSYDKTTRLWNMQNLTSEPIVLSGNKSYIKTLAFSPDGRWLATGGGSPVNVETFMEDKTIRLWDLLNPLKEPEVLHGHEGSITSIAFNPNGNWLATGSWDCTTRLWNLNDSTNDRQILLGHEGGIGIISFSPDGHWLATGSDDKTVRVWDMQSLSANPVILRGHESSLTTLSFSPDGRWLATGSDDKTARVWDMQSLSAYPVILRGHEGSLTTLSFSPDGRWLATGSDDKTVRLWNMQNLKAEPILLWGHNSYIETIAFSPDGRWLATGGFDATVFLWDLHSTFVEPKILRGHFMHINTISFSSSGRWFVTGSADKTARLWDMQNMKAESVWLRGHTNSVISVAFSSDGRWLATGSADKTARLWNMHDLTVDPVILQGHEGSIKDLTFSPDGNWLATGSDDNTARLWNLHNLSSEPVVFRGHKAGIESLVFSPNGRWLATGSSDKTARLWDMDEESLVEKSCKHAGRNLSILEWKRYFPNQEYRKTCSQFPAGT